MPTYEYACAACGHQWEQVQRIVEDPVKVCPKCTQSSAHRLISGGTNFILKGGGWYSDLYSSAKSGATTEASSGATTTDAKSDSPTKSDSASTSSAASPAATPSTPSSTPAAPASST